MSRVDKTLKNILYVLASDFNKFTILKNYSYELDSSDFDEFGSIIFIAAQKYANKGIVGLNKLTKKVLEQEGISASAIKEYFSDVDREAKNNFVLYVEEVQAKKAQKNFNELINVLNSKKNLIDSDDEVAKTEQFIKYAQQTLHKLKPIKKSSGKRTHRDMHRDFANLSSNSGKIPTGITEVDAIIKGMPRGSISILSGMTGQGKTTAANQIMAYAAAVLDLKVMFINLELKEKDFYAKSMALLSGEKYEDHNIDAYNPENEEQLKKHVKRYKEDKLLVEEYYQDKVDVRSGSKTDEELYDLIREAKDTGVDLFVVDYFQLVGDESGDKKSNKTQKLSALQEEVRALVSGSNMAFLWLAQLAESDNPKSHPMQFEIGWCKDLLKSADLELRVWRDYKDETKSTFKPNVWVGFKKARYTEKAEPIEFGFDGNRIGEFINLKNANQIEAEMKYKGADMDAFYENYDEEEDYFEMKNKTSHVSAIELLRREREKLQKEQEALLEAEGIVLTRDFEDPFAALENIEI